MDNYSSIDRVAPDYLLEDEINEQTGIIPEYPGTETPPFYQGQLPIFAPEPSQPTTSPVEIPVKEEPMVINENGQTTAILPTGKFAPTNNKTLLLIGGAVLLYFLFSKK